MRPSWDIFRVNRRLRLSYNIGLDILEFKKLSNLAFPKIIINVAHL